MRSRKRERLQRSSPNLLLGTTWVLREDACVHRRYCPDLTDKEKGWLGFEDPEKLRDILNRVSGRASGVMEWAT
jgi:hypothetical protein